MVFKYPQKPPESEEHNLFGFCFLNNTNNNTELQQYEDNKTLFSFASAGCLAVCILKYGP